MSLEKLTARGEHVGVKAAERVRDRLMARSNPVSGVQIAAAQEGILLSGKHLRHRFVTDPRLRNLIR